MYAPSEPQIGAGMSGVSSCWNRTDDCVRRGQFRALGECSDRVSYCQRVFQQGFVFRRASCVRAAVVRSCHRTWPHSALFLTLTGACAPPLGSGAAGTTTEGISVSEIPQCRYVDLLTFYRMYTGAFEDCVFTISYVCILGISHVFFRRPTCVCCSC